MSVDIRFPVGRIVGGSVHTIFPALDSLGKPKMSKKDPTVPQMKVSFGVAYAKKGTTHWGQTDWGAQIWALAHQTAGALADHPTYAWKIIDGDDTRPNRGHPPKIPCQQEGYPGHWVVWFSNGFLPKTCDATGANLIDPKMIKTGYFCEVHATVTDNASSQTRGLYYNPNAVALSGYGAEIATGVDPSSVGFGAGALPAGASAIPLAQVGTVAGHMGGPGAPGLPSAYPLPGAAMGAPGLPGTGAAGAPGPAPTYPPAPQFLPTIPAPYAAPPVASTIALPPMPGAVALPLPPAGPRMTPAAQGPYEAYRAQGWSDDQMRAAGFLY